MEKGKYFWWMTKFWQVVILWHLLAGTCVSKLFDSWHTFPAWWSSWINKIMVMMMMIGRWGDQSPDLAWQCLGQVAQGFVVPFWKEERLDRLEIVLMKVIKCCCSRWTCYWPGLLDKRLHLFSNLSVVLVDEPEQELALRGDVDYAEVSSLGSIFWLLSPWWLRWPCSQSPVGKDNDDGGDGDEKL